ncbi:MAG: type I-C CRISPR-associated protein Cas8c/Csd1 [Epulopiscium sp. Nuni2H_MBin001]|nr:MAG: type I-C CRISPR-associated protein Cas8c/Csd1 [Epulopiscium sp. Nuni2H_MBin001]
MIITSLVEHYELLVENTPDIPKRGWATIKVSLALDISAEGQLIDITPLKIEVESGKKDKEGKAKRIELPTELVVPEPFKRASNIRPHFLCDTSTYLLGIDKEGKPTKEDRFNASAKYHTEILGQAPDCKVAQAICKFFDNWQVEQALENDIIKNYLAEPANVAELSKANIVFFVEGERALDKDTIKQLWENEISKGSENPIEICLIKGTSNHISRLHPCVKGVQGAQSSGASLVSYNSESFESYGATKAQSYNSHISEYVTFAYTTMLSYLLAKQEHKIILGGDTIVFWAKEVDNAYADMMSTMFNPIGENQIKKLTTILQFIDQGKLPENTDFNTPFYILALAPNSARLSVRFFYRDTFGQLVDNISKHYKRIEIIKPEKAKDYLTFRDIILETVNPNASDKDKGTGALTAELFKAVLNNTPYPPMLYSQVILRLRATQDNRDKKQVKVSYKKVAIIKAYLCKKDSRYKEILDVKLNEETNYTPYVLGRIFSILENIQESAIGTSTIKDQYFNSACVTPSLVFPLIQKLSIHHVKVLKRDKPGLAVNLQKELGQLIDRIDETLPKQMSLEDQGIFIIGYYHETQKRFTKKADK